MDNSNKIVHGLWIGDSLSNIEKLCIHSFIANGHEFWLWLYEPISDMPTAAIVKDANEIIAKSEVFSYSNTNKFGHGKGSYAGFSDIFRYKLLHQYGGWWTDMDITCLKPLNFNADYVFRFHHKIGAVGNLMKLPKNAPIMKYCYEKALAEVNKNNKDWMLPIQILNDGIEKFALENYIQNFTNLDSFPIIVHALLFRTKIDADWKAIHWMNEEWRRSNISKERFYKHAIIAVLFEKYKINYTSIGVAERLKLILRLNRYAYLLINIKARIEWMLKLGKNEK